MKTSNGTKTFTKEGLLNLSFILIYQALKAGEDIESDIILSNASYILGLNGLSITYLKSLIESSFKKPFVKAEMMNDVKTLSLPAIAEKWGRSEQAIINYCNRNNIDYKKRQKRIDLTELENEIRSYNGAYTITELVNKTRHNPTFLKKFCDLNSIPYRRKLC